MRLTLLTVVLAIPSLAACTDYFGSGTFPQFRSMSGLPGSGFGILPSGRLSFSGAMSLSTPIAYSLTGWEVVVGGGILSPDRSFLFSESTTESDGNGSMQVLVGIPLSQYGDVTYSHLFLSSFFDNAVNLQWTPRGKCGRVRFALGVQDITGQGGTSGETGGPRGLDPGESRTYYAVGTWQASDSLFVSLGFGDTRFKGRMFGNASYNLGDEFKFVIDYDTFGWHTGLAIDVGKFGGARNGRSTKVTAMFGFVGGDNAYWSLNFSF